MCKQFQGRDDFFWGITGHHRGYQAYPECYLEDQVRLAAELGVNVYRFNCTPITDDDFRYLDNVLDTCDRYGLELFLIFFDAPLHVEPRDPDFYYQAAKKITARYRGRIKRVQISNEQDVCALDLVKCKDPDGDKPEDYDMVKYPMIRDAMAAMIRGVREGDPAMRTVINLGWKHTGFLDLLHADGVEWDETAIDWYSNMDDPADPYANVEEVLGHIFALPQQTVFVAEANHHEGDYKATEKEQCDYLLRMMTYFYQHPDPRIKGFIIYELLDDAVYDFGEAHYGLLKSDINGHIGRKKMAYDVIRSALQASR